MPSTPQQTPPGGTPLTADSCYRRAASLLSTAEQNQALPWARHLVDVAAGWRELGMAVAGPRWDELDTTEQTADPART